MDNNKFSLILRMHRENSGLTQKDVADILNIERSTYAYYENGTSRPSGSMILKLANILNIDYHIFLNAVRDESPLEEPEDPTFVKLEDSAADDQGEMYTLEIDEQELLMKYRRLTDEQKKVIDDMIKEFLRINNENKEKENNTQ